MSRNLLRIVLAAALLCGALATRADDGGIAVIAHPGMSPLDAAVLQRLYTGRAIEVAGVPATVVNLPASSGVREHFFAQVLATDNDKYVAYWTVRRHIGKGVPPRELDTVTQVIDFVQATPGAIGYIPATEVRPGMNVAYRP
ncbi:MAG TPA: hypothetical protein VMU33_00340 [Burkholderiaceae bacterium]|nr:hypothetical protein [Burkholderiaceae bacterium]